MCRRVCCGSRVYMLCGQLLCGWAQCRDWGAVFSGVLLLGHLHARGFVSRGEVRNGRLDFFDVHRRVLGRHGQLLPCW